MTHVPPLYNWEDIPYDVEAARGLSESLEVPFPLGCVLAGRGYDEPEAARRFLEARMEDLTDPYTMPGVADGVMRIMEALAAEERISIYADYDCDGVVGALVYAGVLRHLGGTVEIFVPKRMEDGYGFTLGALERVIDEQRPDLILTSDCGMRSHEPVADAKESGIDVIVTDHHVDYVEDPPSAVAVINPVVAGTPPALEGLSGSGIAYTLCRALLQEAETRGWSSAKTLDITSYLDLVAIGTISDLMPLVGENRILVRHGLALLNDEKRRRPGLVALTRVAGIRTALGSYEVGFQLGPRISSAGRMGSADLSLKLLAETDPWQARRLAGQLDACNRERKRIENVVMEEAMGLVVPQVDAGAQGLVATKSGWHVGAIGIVAARLSGRYNRPAVIISFDENGLGRGSCRGTPDLSILDVLSRCSSHLIQYGGYKAAAGFQIHKKDVSAFADAFVAACAACLRQDDFVETCAIDGTLQLEEANAALLDAVQRLQPLGVGNQTPVWRVNGVRLQGRPTVVGGDHMKLVLVSGHTRREAIGFGMANLKPIATCLDVVFQLQYNVYRGKRTLQLSLKDFCESQA